MTTYPWEQYTQNYNPNNTTANSQPNATANAWAQYQPKKYTFYGTTSDINLAKQNGFQGNFIDTSTYGDGSKYQDLLHAYQTGANPVILGGAGATGGINDTLYNQLVGAGANITRIGGADRYAVQDNLKNWFNQQNTQPIDFSKLNVEQATIDDIAKKYGFDYSRAYANRQAEAEAQAQKDAVASQQRQNDATKSNTLQGIQNNVNNSQQALDRSYFVKGLQQNQDQTNNGINGGIAADQALRLAMSQNAELAPILRDANQQTTAENTRYGNTALDLLDKLGLINKDQIANADKMYNDRLQQGFTNAMQYTQSQRDNNNQLASWLLQQRGQDLGQMQSDATLAENKRQFDISQQNQMKQAYDTMQMQKQQFGTEQAWRQYQYNNMSATDKAQLNKDISQFGQNMAWQKWETQYQAEMALSQAKASAGQNPYAGPSLSNGSFYGTP
jgi:hypothetical protein